MEQYGKAEGISYHLGNLQLMKNDGVYHVKPNQPSHSQTI
jgi:hypothetical protein